MAADTFISPIKIEKNSPAIPMLKDIPTWRIVAVAADACP
jgi:hypothetical protein